MEGFDKIRNLNLAELGEDPEQEEELMEEVIGAEGGEEISEETMEEIMEEDLAVEEAEEDIPQVKKTIADPVGDYYRVDADITDKELFQFMLGHTYRQPITLILMAACVLLPIVSYIRGKSWGFTLLVCAAIIIYYPFTLFMKAKKTKNTVKTFSETFHYMFDEVGCHLQLTEQAVDVEWKHFQRIMELKSVAILYTSRNNGYILPMKDLGSRKDEILAFIRKQIKR